MGNIKTIGVEWLTDRYDDDLIRTYRKIMYDIMSSEFSVYGEDIIDKLFTLNDNTQLLINNSIIKTPLGVNSSMSVGGTIALLAKYNTPFVIPPDLIKYIKDNITSKELFDKYVSTFPNNIDLLEAGKQLFDIFIDAGYPFQSAYSLVAAVYSECGWDPNIVSQVKNEADKQWTFAREGMFGISNWNDKKKLISELSLDKFVTVYQWDKSSVNKLSIANSRISLDETYYNEGPFPSKTNKHQYACLFQCTEDIWCDIMKKYIEGIPKVDGDDKTLYEYLMYDKEPLNDDNKDDDDHKLLYASYLFKDGKNTKKDFDELKKVIDKSTSYIKYGWKINDFIQQLLIAYILGQYVSGISIEDLSLNDIFPEFGQLHISSVTNKPNLVESIIGNFKDNVKSLFKKGDGNFDVYSSCKWLEDNSKDKSNHVCAKFVRKALEAGGLDTSKRPDWAWKYINYLPTIGFELLGVVNKNNTNGYTPEPGDIAVYMQGNNPSVPGHICMYTGLQWCSDFKQKSMVVYASTQEAYIFRYKFNEEETV